MTTNVLTEHHAQVIGCEFNFSCRTDQKCERTFYEGPVNVIWLATKDRNVRVWVKYNQDDIAYM